MSERYEMHESLHSNFVAGIANVYRPTVYVELGVNVGETWSKVLPYAEQSYGVDVRDMSVQGGQIYIQTTDEFFKHFKLSIDMAFIDADHCFESVMKDFQNVSKLLNPQGVIVLHDTDPVSDFMLDPGLCCDSYRMAEFLQDSQEYNSVTLPVESAGLTIVTKKNNTRCAWR